MLIIIGMLGVAGLLTSQLFSASMHTIDSAPRVQEEQAKLDLMLWTIRRDVWSADQINVNGNAVELAIGSTKIQWKFDERRVSRSTGADTGHAQQWTIPMAVKPRKDDASLVLQAAGNAGETRRFVSQVLLAGEAK
jgi:hypothetical protein